MQDLRVAKRYATALFNEAVRNDTIAAVESDLTAIASLLEHGAHASTFRDFLYSPHVAREEKIRIADHLFSDRVTALTMQFLRLVLEKRRETEFEAIRDEYVTLRRHHGNIIFAEVISAMPLDDKQREAIEKRLTTQTGKRVEAAYDVDPAVIGGVKVQYGNYVLDGTVKGVLARLRDRLRHDLLKQQ